MAKNSLAALKSTDNSVNQLPTGSKPAVSVSVGRKAKPASEKASKAITLKFTEAEFALIEEKSGLIPNATYLKNELRGMFKSEQVVSVQSMNAAISKAAKV
jgi:hypothetical protein